MEMNSLFSRDSFDNFSMGLPENSLGPMGFGDTGVLHAISFPRDAGSFFQEELPVSYPPFAEGPDMVMRRSSSLYFPIDMQVPVQDESMDSISSEIVSTVPSDIADCDHTEIMDRNHIDVMDPSPSDAVDTTQSSVDGSYSEELNPKTRAAEYTNESVDSDDEWTLPNDSDGAYSESRIQSRTNPRHWTREECDRLREAVKIWGCTKHWNQISTYVGTRNVSQCINKWKNDLSKEGKRQRWSPEATTRLRQFLDEGLSMKEIQKCMPEYTYIQIYQQTNKLRTNTDPWEPWEYELLVKLKAAGELSDTDIGRRLNNRHRDVVKNVWSHLKRERNL